MADDDRLSRIEGKLDKVITRFEASQRREGDLDERLADLRRVASTLANAQQRQQRIPPLFVGAVLAASIIGGLVALVGSTALADKPDVHHSRGE